MATISYNCDTCKRSVELVENPYGFTVVGKCVITNGCSGRLYRTERNPNNLRESAPKYVAGLDNYVPRKAFFEYTQSLASDKWNINHNMGVLPSTSVYMLSASGKYELVDNRTYKVVAIDKNNLSIVFPTKVSGLVQCIAKSTVPSIPPTVAPDATEYQVSSNGVITFAVPKYITQLRGSGPSPTPTVALPFNLCTDDNTIEIEIEITKPNEDPFVCFEAIPNVMSNVSPWNGWGEVLIGKRRNYCVRTVEFLKLKVLGEANLRPSDIPDGTRVRFLRIDYGTGRKEVIPSRGLLMLLAKKPHAYADKVKDHIVDVGELIGDTPDYFVYRNGELFLDETKVEKTYPDISRVVYRSAPFPSPTPSPTATPPVTPTLTPSVTISPTETPAPSATSTPEPTATPTTTPTPTVTPTVTPTMGVTPTVTPTVSETPSVTPTGTPASTPPVTPTRTPAPSASRTPTPAPSIILSAVPSNIYKASPAAPYNPTAFTTVINVYASGGSGSYTYSWSATGAASIYSTGPGTAILAFSSYTKGTYSGTVTCTVTSGGSSNSISIPYTYVIT